jgi:hypothetical protein
MPINRSLASSSIAGVRGLLLVTMLVTFGEIVPALAQQLTAQSTRTERVLPSAKLKAPYPPAEEGCRYLKDGRWVDVSCASEEELQRRRLPPPTALNAIQSNPHPLLVFLNRPPIFGTTPIIWGAVSIAFETDPTQATEIDSGGNTNAFSLQTNSNYFVCSTCNSGYPFGAVPGIPNSASQSGDVGWVQFAYQNFGGSVAQLCIWQIDIAISVNTNGATFPPSVNGGYANANQAGYHRDCVSDLPTTATLTGPGAVVPQSSQGQSPAVGDAEVIGYITCPSTGCLLQLVAYLPWANENWWSITKKDVLGLNGNWTNVNGSILGAGGNSTAVFSNTTISQAIAAFSCVNFSAATGYIGEPCATSKYRIGQLYYLSASPTYSPYTGEQNNLTDGPATFTCGPSNCVLLFSSTAP